MKTRQRSQNTLSAKSHLWRQVGWFAARLFLVIFVSIVFAIRSLDNNWNQFFRLFALAASYTAMLLTALGVARWRRVAGRSLTEWDEALAFTLIALLAYLISQAFG